MRFLFALGLSVLVLKGTKRLGSHSLAVEGLRLVVAAVVAAAVAAADAQPWCSSFDLQIPEATASAQCGSLSSM